MNKTTLATIGILSAAVLAGCSTRTATKKFAQGETRAVVAGFSEEDIQDSVCRAMQSMLNQDRIVLLPGASRAIIIVEDVVNDTNSRGRDASVLGETIGQLLRREITNSGKALVYNKEAAQYATVQVQPQYRLASRLTERNLQQDDDDYQKEYNLNLTLVELATGAEFWQERVHIGKLVDKSRVNW